MVVFLMRHGHKLDKLVIDLGIGTHDDDVPVFDLCPSVTTIHLITPTPVGPSSVQSYTTHTHQVAFGSPQRFPS